MNKQIRELAEQAGYTPLPGFDFANDLQEVFLKKFAELIVKECVEVCADRGTHHDGLYSAWAEDCSKRIAKHFGVKE